MTGFPPPGDRSDTVQAAPAGPGGLGAGRSRSRCFGLSSPRPIPLISLTDSLTC